MTTSTDPVLDDLLKQAIGPACHELRSPLAVVYGFARMLESSSTGDEATAKYVSQIVRGAERLDGLLDLLGDVGKVSGGRVHPACEPVKISEVVAAVRDEEGNSSRMVIEGGDPVSVLADGDWLTDVIRLIVDGLCFDEGLDVTIAWRLDGHNVKISMVPNSAYPMIDVEPDKSSLGISLARVRVIAMGGRFRGAGDRILIELPTPSGS